MVKGREDLTTGKVGQIVCEIWGERKHPSLSQRLVGDNPGSNEFLSHSSWAQAPGEMTRENPLPPHAAPTNGQFVASEIPPSPDSEVDVLF